MSKKLHFDFEFFPRKYPCFAVGFFSSGKEFLLHLWLVALRVRWGY